MVHNDISAIVLVRLVAEIILDPQNKVSTKGQNTPKSVPRLIIQVNLYCVICLHPFFLEMPPYFNIVCYTPAMLNSIVLQKKKNNHHAPRYFYKEILCTRFSLCLKYNQKHQQPTKAYIHLHTHTHTQHTYTHSLFIAKRVYLIFKIKFNHLSKKSLLNTGQQSFLFSFL